MKNSMDKHYDSDGNVDYRDFDKYYDSGGNICYGSGDTISKKKKKKKSSSKKEKQKLHKRISKIFKDI